MFVRHVPGKCPLPESSRRPGANRAAKPLIDLALISGRVTRATRGIGAQSRLACEAEHILVFRAANVMRAHRQRIKILPAESSLDLTDWRTAPLGSSHRQCAINAARPEYHSAGWLTMGSRPLMHRGRGHRRVGRPKMSVGERLLADGPWRGCPHERAATGVLAEGLEGAAVTLACARHGVPVAEPRRTGCGSRDGGSFELAISSTVTVSAVRSYSLVVLGDACLPGAGRALRHLQVAAVLREAAPPTTTSRWSPASPAASGAGWSNGT